ncbi:hypothetical protein Q3G72_002636 [Acer saccharum]|nr:hypothetical protein Q3G72_002636 [Acer saccharum]
MNGAGRSNLNPANQNNRTTRDDHDWPHDLNADSMGFYESFYEGRSRFVHDSAVMHQFSHVAGNRPGAGMGTVSMMHQPPIFQRNNVRRPSISTDYQEDLLLGPAGYVTRNARNAVQTANQLLAPDQFFRFNHLVAPLSQQPPLLQEPAANENNGTLFPAGMIVASPNSDQMPHATPDDMPMAAAVAAPEGQTADHSSEHQVMRDRLIAQIQTALRRLGRQSDAFEYNSQLNFSEDDDDIDDEDHDDDDDEDDNMSLDIDDLSLDLDNMSYEALLELEQDMGTASSQFHEDIIQANLRQHKYQPVEVAEGDRNLCCICLEEYAAGDNIGTLDNCVHVYHVTCITLWLEQQNSCPICKAVALTAFE